MSFNLLKRLKNIEDRSNNQLLAIKNVPRPAIKGENNGNFGRDFNQGLIDKNILLKRGLKNLIK